MTPLFRWAGSKRYLADYLLPKFPRQFERYIEPFCGSASLFFLSEPKEAVLGDLNHELINALKFVKSSPERLALALAWMPADQENYYTIRSIQPKSLTGFERAARFLYLNRFCFNGLYRTNRAGEFNVPFGSKPRSAVDESTFIAAASLLRTAKFVIGDFSEVCRDARSGDFVYLDPPYASSEGNGFTEYGARTFGTVDLLRLRHELNVLDKKGAYFMLSYADSADISDIRKRWKSQTVRVRRNIAGFAGHRRVASEVVITNY